MRAFPNRCQAAIVRSDVRTEPIAAHCAWYNTPGKRTPTRREGAFVAVAGVCVLGEGAHRGCDFDMVQVSMERPDANFSTIYRLIAQGMPKSRREGAKA